MSSILPALARGGPTPILAPFRVSVHLGCIQSTLIPFVSRREEADRVDRGARGREDGERKEEARPGELVDQVPEVRLGESRLLGDLVEQRWRVDVCEQVVPFEDDPDRFYGRKRDDDEAHGCLQEGAEGKLERLAARQERDCGPRCGSR